MENLSEKRDDAIRTASCAISDLVLLPADGLSIIGAARIFSQASRAQSLLERMATTLAEERERQDLIRQGYNL